MKNTAPRGAWARTKKGTVLLIVSAALTVGICLVMNLWLMPAIERATQGLRCFDMQFGYSFETAQRFLSLLDDRGRDLYLHAQLPLDFFYPLAYTCCFLCLFLKLRGRADLFCAIPPLLAAADYTENVCVARMLTAETFSPALCRFASAATVCKTVLMYGCLLMIAVFAAQALLRRRKEKAGRA